MGVLSLKGLSPHALAQWAITQNQAIHTWCWAHVRVLSPLQGQSPHASGEQPRLLLRHLAQPPQAAAEPGRHKKDSDHNHNASMFLKEKPLCDRTGAWGACADRRELTQGLSERKEDNVLNRKCCL